jgi:hypothetical protein
MITDGYSKEWKKKSDAIANEIIKYFISHRIFCPRCKHEMNMRIESKIEKGKNCLVCGCGYESESYFVKDDGVEDNRFSTGNFFNLMIGTAKDNYARHYFLWESLLKMLKEWPLQEEIK